jgi:hypothetical protein
MPEIVIKMRIREILEIPDVWSSLATGTKHN